MDKIKDRYKMTELGEIPDEWEIRSLKDVFRVSSGNFLSQKNVVQGEYPVYGGNGITSYHNEYLFEDSKIVIGRVGAKCGCICVSEPKSWITDNALFISDKINEFEDNYMFYLLNYMNLNQYANQNAQPVISGQKIYSLKVMFPPIQEQQRISLILSSIDEKIEITDNLIEKTKELKKGLMQKLLTKGIGHDRFKDTEIGRIPEAWEVVQMGEASTFINGRAYKRTEFKEKGTPIIRIQNLTGEGNFVYSDMDLEEDKYVEYGDLIYAWSATFGPFIWKGLKGIYHYHIWKVECNKNKIDKIFFYYRLNYISAEMNNQKNGSAFSHITKAFMEKHRIALPPILEQQQIALILSSLDEKIEQNEAKKEKFQQLKKGLMQKLLTGKIRVNV